MDIFLKEKTISISILNIEDIEKFLIKLYEFRNISKINNIIIHFDVMDGEFVNNYFVNLDLIKVVKKYNFFVDVHLMCSKPKEYIDKAILLGADNITIHYEIDNIKDNLKYLNNIKEKLKSENRELSIGLSIKPGTDIGKISNYLNMCDVILLMSVEPGLGGQTYIEEINEKIKVAKDMKKTLQIDGGINENTIVEANKLGINSFVIGSYLTKDIDNIVNNILKIEEIIK